jgi:very-short-patch-repair endonuclease
MATRLDAKIIRWASQRKRIIERSKVYAVGTPATHALERPMAAITACGKGSLLADEAALAHWGFIDKWPRHLTILTPNNRRPKGLKVHRSATLTNQDRRVYNGVPVTSPARALLDAAVFLGGRTLMRVVNDALHTRHVLGRFTVDAIFLAERMIVELDGWDSHSGRDRFEADRDRDAENLLAGHPTVRITWYRLKDESDREAARLQAMLDQRRVEVAALDAYRSQNVA